jgi:predicted HTH transcriptional regulator
MEWKWSINEPYEKTRRVMNKKVCTLESQDKDKERESDFELLNSQETSAYSSALNHDENTWSILNNNYLDIAFRDSNKREETDKKLSERELVGQIGMNPYLSNLTYADDVTNHQDFLKSNYLNNIDPE